MNVERLRKIIAYSDKNREEIYSMVKRFCSFAGVEYDSDLLNILQIVRSSFQRRDILFLKCLLQMMKLDHCAIEAMDWGML